MSGMTTNTSGLTDLQRAFKKASKEQRKAYRSALKKAGEITADVARAKVAEVSPKTAASIRVGARGQNAVVIRAGDGREISRLLEGDGRGKPFRHPLFGDREHWYTQQSHPFMFPAYLSTRKIVGKEIRKVIKAGLPKGGD